MKRALYVIYACLVVVSGLFLLSNSGTAHRSHYGSRWGSSYSSGGGWFHK
jgi:hypothetical protein